MQFFLIHSFLLLLMILTKYRFLVKKSQNPPELSSEGLLNLFRYDIYKLVGSNSLGNCLRLKSANKLVILQQY